MSKVGLIKLPGRRGEYNQRKRDKTERWVGGGILTGWMEGLVVPLRRVLSKYYYISNNDNEISHYNSSWKVSLLNI